jgi:hypothetical protein
MPWVTFPFGSGPGWAYAPSGPTTVVPVSASYYYDVLADPDCWEGALTSFEMLLCKPLPGPNADAFRLRFLHTLTSTRATNEAARVLVQMSCDTEIGVITQKLITFADSIFTSQVCSRRKYIDIDADMQQYGFLVDAAVAELTNTQVIPLPYLQLYQLHMQSPQPRYRVCAMASLLCLATYYAFGAG